MKKVTIYSTPTCHLCKAAKAFFAKHNVGYINNNVATNRALADEMVAKSGQMGVPVIDIEGQIVVGFDEPRLREILEIK